MYSPPNTLKMLVLTSVRNGPVPFYESKKSLVCNSRIEMTIG